MPMCAIYARVSDESQLHGESIQHQIGFAKTFARRRAMESGEQWETPDALVYVDRGITGTSMVKRAAVRSLIEAAQNHQFDVVLFKGISRFARDTVDALVMLRTLIACQVRVISIEENYDSLRDSAEFVFTIHSALAQAESEKTSIRVRMGAMEKAKAGQWNGRPPDGYRLNRETKRLEIDELFAPIVEEIFRLYRNGHGCRTIASLLNKQSLSTRQGKRWTQRYVSRLLKNPAYAGDVVYGRRTKRMSVSKDDDGISPKRKTVLSSDEEDQVICRDAHPPIVDREMFNSVNAMFENRRVTPGREGHLRLLSRGILRCVCGASMTVKHGSRQRAYYRCTRQAESGSSVCNMPYLNCADVDQVVLHRVQQDVLPRLDFSSTETPSARERRQTFERIRSERDQYYERTVRLFEKYADGELDDSQFTHLNQFIRNRIQFLNTIETKLQQQADHVSDTSHLDAPKSTRQLVLDHLTNTRLDPHFTRELLQLFVERVEILSVENQQVKLRMYYRIKQS